MNAEKLTPPPTPLQEQSRSVHNNIRRLNEIQRLVNGMQLNAETREAWHAFKDLVWEQIQFQRRQRDMYSNGSSAQREAVRIENNKKRLKERAQKEAELRAKVKEYAESELAKFDCKACRDTGRKKNGVFCLCITGCNLVAQEQFRLILNTHPNWKEDPERGLLCDGCNRSFKKRKFHQCYPLDWRFTDDEEFIVCIRCRHAEKRKTPFEHYCADGMISHAPW